MMRVATLLYLAAVLCVSTSAVSAQGTTADSAEIYERLANTNDEAPSAVGGRSKLRDARRAVALYEQRNDTVGMVRSLLLVAESYDHVRIDSLIVVSRRAMTMLRGTRADSSLLAEVVGLLAYGLLNSPAPLDSSAMYRAENLRLRRLYPSPRKQANELWAHGQAFSARQFSDLSRTAKSSASDSAIAYLQAAVSAARIANDSAAIAGVFGDIGNVWAFRSRYDSALVYRQRGFEISRRIKNRRQMTADLASIVQYFRTAPRRDPSRGLIRNADSALAWTRITFREFEQFGTVAHMNAALLMSLSHQNSGNADSARYYVELAKVNAARINDPNLANSARVELARWYDRAGFSDSSLVMRRESAQRAGAMTGSSARMLQLLAWQSLARTFFDRGDLDSAMTWYRAASDTAGLSNAAGLATNQTGVVSTAVAGIAEVHRWRGTPDSAIAVYRTLLGRGALLGEAAVLSGLGMADSAQVLVQRELTAMANAARPWSARDSIGPLSALASIHRQRGSVDSARALDAETLRAAQDESMVREEIEAHVSLGADHEALGVLDSAYAHYVSAVAIAERRRMRPLAVLSLGALASWHLAVDAPDSAVAIARRAIARATETASPWLLADARYRLGIIFGALGQSDSAATYLEATLGQAGRPVGPSLVALGNLRLRMGQADTARALLKVALRSYRASGARPAMADADVTLARRGTARTA